MKKVLAFLFLLFIGINCLFSQQGQPGKKIKVTGKVIEKNSSQPLEYATIVLQSTQRADVISGGITNAKGEFDIEIIAGTYDIRVEFISFKTVEIKQRAILENTNLGIIGLVDETTQLGEVVLRAEQSTVDIKLDKRVYNVGQDMMVKGGTVSDVLDNVPSVAVDVDGTVSLRGNESVRILIDGRPSNAININDALRLIPAEAIDKVEIITNPSARYDAEGGGGIINIILKKGKNSGINGTITGVLGDPTNRGITGTINYKNKDVNLFTTQGYNYSDSPANGLTDTEYLNPDGSTRNFIYEDRSSSRIGDSYNGNFGFDWFLTEKTTWTNIFTYRENTTENPQLVTFANFDENKVFQFDRTRVINQDNEGQNIDVTTNVTHKFDKEGHQLTVDANYSKNTGLDFTGIEDSVFDNQRTLNDQIQERSLLQTDYVKPFGKTSRFEAGYKGEFIENLNDFSVEDFDEDISDWVINPNISNLFEYKEKVHAFYAQYGSKINKFSYFFGLRWEDSNIDVNQLSTNDLTNKRYNNFFPSAVFSYEIDEKTNTSLSYSRRIRRPRGFFLNPFPNLTSNINIFQGNPDLDPAMTHAVDLVYLQKFGKLTLSSSAYYNMTEDSFQFIRTESGQFVENIVDGELVITPIIITTPINLANEYRFGFEFNLNYNPYKWWKLNGNFNFFRNETAGEYSYEDFLGNTIVQDLDNVAVTWTTRITSRITLPYKIDWQLNGNYRAPETRPQGKSLGIASANTSLSKDILKDKATIALNVSDIFNTRKRITETSIPGVINSYDENQFRERQINLSFTYRFNKQKNERERQQRRENGEEPEFMG
ncbi:TonB-dependent receptor domain-containing protein [Flavobacterium sp.]|jgi:outer membrane cobalamin receptor|uniref:TonB-dependent receptor domain-containing protein n=1 Tax=Flavobacterium sp. TaxID=239 RepID=UPI0037C05533